MSIVRINMTFSSQFLTFNMKMKELITIILFEYNDSWFTTIKEYTNKMDKKPLYNFLYAIFKLNLLKGYNAYIYKERGYDKLCNYLYEKYSKKISVKRFKNCCRDNNVKYEDTYFYYKLYVVDYMNKNLPEDVSKIICSYV